MAQIKDLWQDDFDEWNDDKKFIHSADKNDIFINEREIWYIKMGINIWFEQNWKKAFRRPVLIIKKIWNLFFSIPLTTNIKRWIFYYKIKEKIKNKESCLILSQWRVYDKKRFMDIVWIINKDEFEDIKKILRDMYL